MHKVKNFDHFKQLLKGLKDKRKKLHTNCFLYPAEIETLSARGKLYYIFLPPSDGLYFFVDNHDYYNLYFYIEITAYPEFSLPKLPLILDFVYKENHLYEPLAQQLFLWQQFGFKVYKKYIRLAQNIDTLSLNSKPKDALSNNYTYGFSDYNLAAEIHSLWEKNLDPLNIAIPNKSDIIHSMNNDEIFFLTDANNNLCAALQTKITGSKAIIQHVVVAPQSRGNGLSFHLLANVFQSLKQRNIIESQLWVDLENIAAMRLYEKCGYLSDHIFSIQLLLNKERGGIMKAKLLEILTDIRGDVDFEKQTNLVDDGLLDSFDLVSMVGELNDCFEIDINVEHLLPENFNSLNSILELVTKLKSEK